MNVKVIYVCENKIKKEHRELKGTIEKAVKDLADKIVQCYKSGIAFNNIYNADNIKYDKHGNDFFTYKAHGKNKSQLRLLYACVQNDEATYLLIIDYIEKRKRTTRGCGDHIDKFSKYDDLDFNVFCKHNNICIANK